VSARLRAAVHAWQRQPMSLAESLADLYRYHQHLYEDPDASIVNHA
jgi:hypothetical protein